MTTKTKMPPPPPEVESALVGALLEGDIAQVLAAAELVNAADFEDPRLALVFEVLLSLAEANSRIDVLIVAEALKKMGRLAEIGGPAFLSSDFLNGPRMMNIPEWAAVIRERGARRHLASVAMQIAGSARDDTIPLPTVLDDAGASLNRVLTQRARTDWRAMPALLEELLSDLDRRKQAGGTTGLATGLPDVDQLLDGLEPGELVILAARPGVGKTAMALQIAGNVARGEAMAVGVFSLEMPAVQLLHRLTAAEAKVDSKKLRGGRLSPAEEERIADAAERCYRWPLSIDDSAGSSVGDLRAKARRLKQQQPSLGLLVVDYLQLVRVRQRVENRQVEVSEVSRGLKELAKELELPVLALSQMSRRVEERRGRPMLSDLRESGAIEQDADTVIFLHRETGDEDEAHDAGASVAVELIVAKKRNGSTGVVPLTFLGPTTRFEGRAFSNRT